MARAHIFITGDVIGVGFRAWIVQLASNLGLYGWVKNIYSPKQAVEAVFEGKKENVEKMVELCQKGPEVSWVEKVEVKREEATGEFDEFSVTR